MNENCECDYTLNKLDVKNYSGYDTAYSSSMDCTVLSNKFTANLNFFNPTVACSHNNFYSGFLNYTEGVGQMEPNTFINLFPIGWYSLKYNILKVLFIPTENTPSIHPHILQAMNTSWSLCNKNIFTQPNKSALFEIYSLDPSGRPLLAVDPKGRPIESADDFTLKLIHSIHLKK